jgi:hypothetical protein
LTKTKTMESIKKPNEIFRKIIEDKKVINNHLLKGGKLEELRGIKFTKPQSLRNI